MTTKSIFTATAIVFALGILMAPAVSAQCGSGWVGGYGGFGGGWGGGYYAAPPVYHAPVYTYPSFGFHGSFGHHGYSHGYSHGWSGHGHHGRHW